MPSLTISRLTARHSANDASNVQPCVANHDNVGNALSGPVRSAALAMLMINIGTQAAITAGTIQRWRRSIGALDGKQSTARRMIGNDNGVISQLNHSMTGPMIGTAVWKPTSGPLFAAAVAINASVINAAVVPRAPRNISTAAPIRNAVVCASAPR